MCRLYLLMILLNEESNNVSFIYFCASSQVSVVLESCYPAQENLVGGHLIGWIVAIMAYDPACNHFATKENLHFQVTSLRPKQKKVEQKIGQWSVDDRSPIPQWFIDQVSDQLPTGQQSVTDRSLIGRLRSLATTLLATTPFFVVAKWSQVIARIAWLG